MTTYKKAARCANTGTAKTAGQSTKARTTILLAAAKFFNWLIGEIGLCLLAVFGLPPLLGLAPWLPLPMPMFLMAPPNPVDSWPLKWVRLIRTSASIMARPILAVLQYSPLGTGTSTSSVPRRPSPIRIWQPVVMGQKPFSWAHSRCSRAFFRLPGYRVLQSVKKGMPPCSLHRSATTLA